MRNILLTFAALLAAASPLVGTEPEAASPAPVFIVAGQSNTDGRVPANQFTSEIGNVENCYWRFGSYDQERTNGHFEPFTPADTTERKFDRWAYDAQLYKNIGARRGRPFYVLKWSMGGTSIDTLAQSTKDAHWCADTAWMHRTGATKSGGHSLLLSLEETMDDAIKGEFAALPQGYEFKAFVWHQGESDRKHGAAYYGNLRQVITHVREFLAKETGNEGYLRLPFIFGSVSRLNRQYDEEVYLAMKQLAADDPDIHLIDVGEAELLDDGLHFTAKSAKALGNEMYREMLRLGIIE